MDSSGEPPMVTDREELWKLLSVFLDRVRPSENGIDYRLVGTGAALAQGVRLPVGDIDLLVARRGDVDRIAAALAEFPCPDPPAWLPAGQYFTRFRIDGVRVEVSTLEQPDGTGGFRRVPRGPWDHWVRVEHARHTVPAGALELQLAADLLRDRPERYNPLVEHLRAHGADVALLRRSMAERGVGPEQAERVLGRLRHR